MTDHKWKTMRYQISDGNLYEICKCTKCGAVDFFDIDEAGEECDD